VDMQTSAAGGVGVLESQFQGNGADKRLDEEQDVPVSHAAQTAKLWEMLQRQRKIVHEQKNAMRSLLAHVTHLQKENASLKARLGMGPPSRTSTDGSPTTDGEGAALDQVFMSKRLGEDRFSNGSDLGGRATHGGGGGGGERTKGGTTPGAGSRAHALREQLRSLNEMLAAEGVEESPLTIPRLGSGLMWGNSPAANQNLPITPFTPESGRRHIHKAKEASQDRSDPALDHAFSHHSEMARSMILEEPVHASGSRFRDASTPTPASPSTLGAATTPGAQGSGRRTSLGE
jgi:hypothetical protein